MDHMVSHALNYPTVNLLSYPLMAKGATGLQANIYPPIELNKLVTKEVPVKKEILKKVEMTAAHSLKMKAEEEHQNEAKNKKDDKAKDHSSDKKVETIHD